MYDLLLVLLGVDVGQAIRCTICCLCFGVCGCGAGSYKYDLSPVS